jgi:hypothetical protein
MNPSLLTRSSALLAWGLAVVMLGASCSDSNDHCAPNSDYECLNSPDDCSAQLGCRLETGCVVVNCSAQTTSESCRTVPTCKWTGLHCATGDPSPCRALDEPACKGVAGCTWGTACVGQLVRCTGTHAECDALPHCHWESRPDL